MTALLFLVAAICCEVVATAFLRVAALGRHRLYAVVAVGYLAAFTLLSLALDAGLGLGAAYGIWTAAGVALTAIVARVVFGERLHRITALGIVVIIAGVLCIRLGAAG